MKILSAKQIREADSYTILNEPISSTDLMERAAGACFKEIVNRFPDETSFHVFCGMGNNGGDGLVIARLLSLHGKEAHIYTVQHSQISSAEFDVNHKRLIELNIPIQTIIHVDQLPLLNEGVVIDALLGSGITRPMEGLLSQTANHINISNRPIVSIDLPSGLYDRNNTDNNLSTAIRANLTLTFQVPKLCLFNPELSLYIGDWQIIEIGLNETYIQGCSSDYETFGLTEAAIILKQRDAHSHKGTFGHVGLAVGSKGKMGAAVLCAESCLRAGSGLLTCMIPACGYEIMQQRIPEAMVLVGVEENYLDDSFSLENFNVIGCGPGISVSQGSISFVHKLLSCKTPLVLDADALNILASQPSLKEQLPQLTILTPHPKEFERLFGDSISFSDRIELLRQEAVNRQIIILLKGHYTAVASPDGLVTFNLSGNPGMATAGSGDVLTGIIAALLAQGYTAPEAARLGAFIHGHAGDSAAKRNGQESMIASDIIANLGEAFKSIHDIQE